MSAWTRLMEPGPALLILVLVLCPQLGNAAPFEESTEIEYYPVADATGCYYNFEHYDEGDRIITNEPCLNCTCHNRMLMCYLRVCPFTKAIGQDCKVEKKSDQCCPVITCPEVPVHLEPQASTPSTALGHLNEYGCSIDNLFYADGAKVPSNPNNPCEVCYCIRNRTACIIQECTLTGKVAEGCRPVYIEGVCCPLRYDCDHPEIETTPRPLLTSTTTTTTTTTTTIIPPTSSPTDCMYNNQVFIDGALLKKDVPCEKCYCMKGDIICAVQKCGPTPLDKVNCTALPIKEGQCCPDTYDCDMVSEEDLTTLSYYDVPTTQPTIIATDTVATVFEGDEKSQTTKAPVELIPEQEVVTEQAQSITATTPAAIATRITEAVTEIVEAITSSIFGTTEEPEKEKAPEKEYKKPSEEEQAPEKETEKPLDEQEKPTNEEKKPTDEEEKTTNKDEIPSSENVTREQIAEDSEVTITEGTVKQPITEAALSHETELMPEHKPEVLQEPEITPTETEERITEDSVKMGDEHSYGNGLGDDDSEDGEDNEVLESDVQSTGKPEVSTTVVSSSEDAHTRPIDQEYVPSQETVEEKETTTVTSKTDVSPDTQEAIEASEVTQDEKSQITTQRSFTETADTEKPYKAVSDESTPSTNIPVESPVVTKKTTDNESDETVTQLPSGKPSQSQEDITETPSVGLPVVTDKTEETAVTENQQNQGSGNQIPEGDDIDIVKITESPTEGANSDDSSYPETNDQREVTEETPRITLTPQKEGEGGPGDVTESQPNQENEAIITEKAFTEIPGVTVSEIEESKPESDTVTESQSSQKGQETTKTSVITEAPKKEETPTKEITEEIPAVTETIVHSENEPESSADEKIHTQPTEGALETEVSVTESHKNEKAEPHIEEDFTKKAVTETPIITETQTVDEHIPGHIDIEDAKTVTTEKLEAEEEMEIVTGIPMKETEKPQSMDHVSETTSPEIESNEVEKHTPSIATTEHILVTQQVHTEEPIRITEVSEILVGTEIPKLSEESTEMIGHIQTETVPEQHTTEKKPEQSVTDVPPTPEEGSGQEEPTEDTEGSGEPETPTESYDHETPPLEPELVTDISTEPKNVHHTTSLPDKSSDITTRKSEVLTESSQGTESTEKSITAEKEAPLPSHDVLPEISEGGLDENVSEKTEAPEKETLASEIPKISETISSEVTTQPGPLSEVGVSHKTEIPEKGTVASQQPEETATESRLATSESTTLPDKIDKVDLTEETLDEKVETTEKIKPQEPEIPSILDVTEPASEHVDITEPSIHEITTTETTIEHGVSGEAEVPKEIIAESTQSPADTSTQDEVVTEKALTPDEPIVETSDHTAAPGFTVPSIGQEPEYSTEQPKIPEEHEPTRDSVDLEVTVTESEEEHGIPGEGSCLVDGQTYRNNSSVPPFNQCQLSCKCVSSILQCESVQCLAPPSNLEDCMPVFQSPGSCCPTYSCSVPSATSVMESDSHVIETTTADREGEIHETTSQSVPSVDQKTISSIPTGDMSEIPIQENEVETTEHGIPEIAVTSVDDTKIQVSTSTALPLQEVAGVPQSTDSSAQVNKDVISPPVVHGNDTEKSESTPNPVQENEEGTTEYPAHEDTENSLGETKDHVSTSSPVIPQEQTGTPELDKEPQILDQTTSLPIAAETVTSLTEEESNELKPSYDNSENEIPEKPVVEPHIIPEHCSSEGCAPIHPSVEVQVTEENVKETESPSVTKSPVDEKEDEADKSKPGEKIFTPQPTEKEIPKPDSSVLVVENATENQEIETSSSTETIVQTQPQSELTDSERTTPSGETITKSAETTPIPEKYPTGEMSTAKPRKEPDSTEQLSSGQTTSNNIEHQTPYPADISTNGPELGSTEESGQETPSDHDKHPIETTVSEGDKSSDDTTDAVYEVPVKESSPAYTEKESDSSAVTESVPKETQDIEEGISEQKPEEDVETTSEESSETPEEGTELPKKEEIDTSPSVSPESITEKISEVLGEQSTEKIPMTVVPVQSSEKTGEQDNSQNATVEPVSETSTRIPESEKTPEISTGKISQEKDEKITTIAPVSNEVEHVPAQVIPSEQNPVTSDEVEEEADGSTTSKPFESADHVTKDTKKETDEQEQHVTPSEQKPIDVTENLPTVKPLDYITEYDDSRTSKPLESADHVTEAIEQGNEKQEETTEVVHLPETESEKSVSTIVQEYSPVTDQPSVHEHTKVTEPDEVISSSRVTDAPVFVESSSKTNSIEPEFPAQASDNEGTTTPSKYVTKEGTETHPETEEVNTEKHLEPSEIVTAGPPESDEIVTEFQPESEDEHFMRPIETVIEDHPESEGAVTETHPVEVITKSQPESAEGEITKPLEIATEGHSESEISVTETHPVEVITKSQPGIEGGESTRPVEIATEGRPESEESVTEIHPVEVITESQSGTGEEEPSSPVEIVTEGHTEPEASVTETYPVEVITKLQPGFKGEEATRPVEIATEGHPESEESVTEIHPVEVVTKSEPEIEGQEHTKPAEIVTESHPKFDETVTETHPVEVITKSHPESEGPKEIVTESLPESEIPVTEIHPAEDITKSQPGNEGEEIIRPVEVVTENYPESEASVTDTHPVEVITESQPENEVEEPTRPIEIVTEGHPESEVSVTEPHRVEVVTKSEPGNEGEEFTRPVEIATEGHPKLEESVTEIQAVEVVTKSQPGSDGGENTGPVEIVTEGHPESEESVTEIHPVEFVTQLQPGGEEEKHSVPVEIATEGHPGSDKAVTETRPGSVLEPESEESVTEIHPAEVVTKSHPGGKGEEPTGPVEIATEGHTGSDEEVTETHPGSIVEEHTRPEGNATEGHPESEETVTEIHSVEVVTKSQPGSELGEHNRTVEISTEGHPESEEAVTGIHPVEVVTKSQPGIEEEHTGPVEIATEGHPGSEESVTETHPVEVITKSQPGSGGDELTRPVEIATEGHPKPEESVTGTHPVTKSAPGSEGEAPTRPGEIVTEGYLESEGSVTELHPVEVITKSQPEGATEGHPGSQVSVTETYPVEVITKLQPEDEGQVYTVPVGAVTEGHSDTVTESHSLEPVEIVSEIVTESRPDTGELVTDTHEVEITTKLQPGNESEEQHPPVEIGTEGSVPELHPIEVITKAQNVSEAETTESYVKPEEEITDKQPGLEEVITKTSSVPKETITVGPETVTAEEITVAHSVTEVDEKPLPGVEETKTESPSGEMITESIQAVTRKPEHESPILPNTEQTFTSSPHHTTQGPRNDSELYTSGPSEEQSTKKHVEGELSTSVPASQSHTTAEPIREPKPDHGIPGEQEHVPELPDYQSPTEDYDEEDQSPLGPGTCRYGGKVFVSAQQIPRDDPCDFCFCFRSDIICLQQSCPPPIPNCHEEPIRGFCCPRYECPVGMATSLNLTTTSTTTTTTLPPHFLAHAYNGMATKNGCQVRGQAYRVGDYIKSASGPCMHCTCGADGQMKCDPKQCSPEPMLRQMIAAAASRRRR